MRLAQAEPPESLTQVFGDFTRDWSGHMLITGNPVPHQPVQISMQEARQAGWNVIGVTATAIPDSISIGPESSINIFDIVVDTSDASWVNSQAAIVLNQLGLLLGRPGRSPDGKEQRIQRDFSVQERGFLSRAILSLYETIPPDAPPRAMPIISDLIARLEADQDASARSLTKNLRMLCFGTTESEETLTAEGRMFNRHSTVEWDFSTDVALYDFSKVPDRYRPFYYSMAIGAINRYMRDPRRDVKRRTLLMIDEFGYVTQVAAVAQMAADICKVARKYGIALVVIDQNPTTFLDTAAGRVLWENTETKVIFSLDEKQPPLVGDALSISPQHREYLNRIEEGKWVMVRGDDRVVGDVGADQ